MIRMELSLDEAEILRDILETTISGIREEIHHTDHREYREGLKRREAALEGLLGRFEAERKPVSA